MGVRRKRLRTVMVVEQLELMTLSLEDLDKVLLKEAQYRKKFAYAYIIHDKDMSKGVRVKPHIHLIMRTAKGSGLTIQKWAEMVRVPQQQVEIFNGYFANAVAYLLHETTEARNNPDKKQYDVGQVHGNIDVQAILSKATKNIVKANSNRVKVALEQLDSGAKEYHELADSLLGDDKVQFLRKAKDIIAYQGKKPKPLTPLKIYYLYGGAGAGKTRLARFWAGSDYFVTNSSRDPLGRYDGQKVVILDDIRATTFEPDELLRLLDPYNDQRIAPARYHDKDLRQVEAIYITNINAPIDFWKNGYRGEPYSQFERRITESYRIDSKDEQYEVESTGEKIDLPWKKEDSNGK